MTKQHEFLRTVLLHLSLIPRVGPSTVERLVAALGHEGLYEVYHWRPQELSFRAGLSIDFAEIIVQGLADKELLAQELRLIERYRISWTTFLDNDYPDLLKQIHLPPLVLYWKGTLVSLKKCVAFVGSRMATVYSEIMLKRLIPPLIARNWVIVSGGALGADAMAHRITLEEGGSTVAVIGSGLLKPYPKSHSSLFTSIVESNGIVMSSFPLTMSAVPGNFPARNRIIAGLSRAVIVTQAGEQSGALITASYAVNEGREVGAVPGSLIDGLSSGYTNCYVRVLA